MALEAQNPPALVRNHRLRAWLVLGLIIVACLPALMVGIGQRLSTHTMENVALVTSQETWLRVHHGESNAWLVSTNDGKPRLEKPPLLTWLNLLAWSDLDPATATPQQLTLRARCVSVSMGLLMLASVFWIGVTLADVRLAALAALAVGSTFFFQRQARTASYDIHYAAWTTLAVAAGLWAMRPFGPIPTTMRRVVGWGCCMVALTAAAMSKNPLPYLMAVPPLIAAIVKLSPAKRTDAFWLTAITLLSAVPVGAWYWHVFANYREVAEVALGREVVQPRAGDFQPVYYYLGLLGLVVPWTLWLVGGLIEPFKLERGSRRRIAMFALFWFAFVFIVHSIPPAKQQRYILAIMPAVGLLIAMLFRQHAERAAIAQRDRLFERIFAATWIALGVVSVAAAPFLAMNQRLLAWFTRGDEIAAPVIASTNWPVAVAASVMLLALAVVGWSWHRSQPWKSAVAMAAWMLVLMAVFWRQEAMNPTPRVQAFVDEAARMNAIIDDAPLYSLRWVNLFDNWYEWKINEEFRFYLGRTIPRVQRDEFEPWIQRQTQTTFIMVRPADDATELLQRLGLTLIDQAMVDKDDLHEVWKWTRRDATN